MSPKGRNPALKEVRSGICQVDADVVRLMLDPPAPDSQVSPWFEHVLCGDNLSSDWTRLDPSANNYPFGTAAAEGDCNSVARGQKAFCHLLLTLRLQGFYPLQSKQDSASRGVRLGKGMTAIFARRIQCKQSRRTCHPCVADPTTV